MDFDQEAEVQRLIGIYAERVERATAQVTEKIRAVIPLGTQTNRRYPHARDELSYKMFDKGLTGIIYQPFPWRFHEHGYTAVLRDGRTVNVAARPFMRQTFINEADTIIGIITDNK